MGAHVDSQRAIRFTHEDEKKTTPSSAGEICHSLYSPVGLQISRESFKASQGWTICVCEMKYITNPLAPRVTTVTSITRSETHIRIEGSIRIQRRKVCWRLWNSI